MLALTLASCSSDDDYQRASVSGEQVYFPNTLSSTIETSPDATSFTVPVYRINTVGELTVPLTITMAEGSIYTPTAQQVTFADGSNEAALTFTYNPNDIVFGDYYNISIAINGEELLSDYGVSTYSFKAGKTAWVDMDGVATYREDIITALFGVDNLMYEVPVQENVVTPGIYRLINPYGEAYEYNEPGDWDDSQDYFLTINATDPDHVYVERGELGVDWSYGMMSAQSMVTYYMAQGQTVEELIASHPEYFGTLSNGVITMPARSLLFSMADYRDGAWYTGNGSGMFAVALPGAKIADYSVEFTYLGRLTDSADNDFIRGKFKLGKDIYSVKYAIAPESEDVDAVIEGVIDGSVESGEIKRADNEPFEVAMNGESGKYNLVVVVYDASGEAVSNEVFEVKYKSSKDNAETWSPINVGTYVYGQQSLSQSGKLFYDQVYTDEGLILYQSDSDDTRYRIAPWCASEETGLVFTMDDATGNLVVDGVETGEESDYGMIFATDVKTYGAADMDSYYENGVFYFYLAYHVPAGVFAYVLDTFTLTGNDASAPKRAASVSNGSKNVRMQLAYKQLKRVTADPIR